MARLFYPGTRLDYGDVYRIALHEGETEAAGITNLYKIMSLHVALDNDLRNRKSANLERPCSR
jgi:hypothetical protein